MRAVLAGHRTAPLTEAERALFAFIEKVNHQSPCITQADIETLHQNGWTDEAIYDAITVCALFNFYNRWVDASGVHDMRPEDYRRSGQRLAARGYLMSAEPPR